MLKKIEQYIREKKYEDALTNLAQLTGDILKDNKYILLYAHVAYRCNDYDKANKYYQKVFNKKIQNSRAYAEYSDTLLKTNQDQNAKKILLDAIDNFPENISFIRILINIFMKEKAYASALVLSKNLLSIDSKNITSYKILIDILFKQEKYLLVKNKLQECIVLFGEKDFLLEELKYYITIKDYPKALDKYKLLATNSPSNYIYYIGQYRMYIYLEDNGAAENILLDGLQKIDEKNKIYTILGNIYFQSQRYRESIYYLKLSILDDTNDLNVRKKIIKIYILTGNFQLALEHIHTALKVFPNDVDLNLEYGITEMKLYNFSKAEKIFDKILKESPQFIKAKSYLIALFREKKRRENEIKKYQKLKLNIPKNISDYHSMIDMEYNYMGISKAIVLCNKTLDKKKNDIITLSKLVVLYMESNDLDKSYIFWKRILSKKNNHVALLYILRHYDQYFIESTKVQELKDQSVKRISSNIKYKKKHKIAILGGSNTIMTDGWSPIFKQHLSLFLKSDVDNFGLGGISSLYGLFIAKEKNLYQKYDTIIFEYTLNDIYFNYFQGYDHRLLESVLEGLVADAKKFGTRIIFMLMTPLDNIDKLKMNTCQISQIYYNVANRFDNAFIFDIYDIIESKKYSTSQFISMLYRDNMHYTSSFSQHMSDIFTHTFFDDAYIYKSSNILHKNKKSLIDMSNITLMRPNLFNIVGAHSMVKRETKIISENFLCIRGEDSIVIDIPKGKRVLALLINSSESTGYIKVNFGDETFIKNIFAERPINDPEKARIYLKQFTKIMLNTDGVTYLRLSPNVNLTDLENLDLDTTVYPQVPKVPLINQELEIAGILIV